MSLVEDAANKEAIETRVPFGTDEVTLFQVRCDRCDQQNYSVKGHHHYRGT
jgi:hypothetical protein